MGAPNPAVNPGPSRGPSSLNPKPWTPNPKTRMDPLSPQPPPPPAFPSQLVQYGLPGCNQGVSTPLCLSAVVGSALSV